jgi:hypothetical protein
MDYCNEVQGFINYTISNPRDISGSGIRCSCKRCKNKKFLDPDVVTIHLLQKGFIEQYMFWYIHREPYVPHEIMVERMIGSTFNASNVHGVIDDNSNPYRNMVMDMMRMNQGHTGSIIDEEPNANVTKVFDLLKDFDEPLWDGCTNHNKLSIVAHVFTSNRIKEYKNPSHLNEKYEQLSADYEELRQVVMEMRSQMGGTCASLYWPHIPGDD